MLNDTGCVKHKDLLIGLHISDDAAVYKMSDDRAIVQTMDFFTPIVDDPYEFGAIAATNSLSDIYAMGGNPLIALNILCIPEKMALEFVSAILQGGLDKVTEAGAVVAGGHSIYDKQPKYGLSVTGDIHPQKILTKANARPGDRIVLTKPLGTAFISKFRGYGKLSKAAAKIAIDSMKKLNKVSSQIFQEHSISCCTDVSGFGLIGHCAEIAEKSGVGFKFYSENFSLLPEVEHLADKIKWAGGLKRNREGLSVVFGSKLTRARKVMAFSPETSGGLLAAIPEAILPEIKKRFEDSGEMLAEIGEFTDSKTMELL